MASGLATADNNKIGTDSYLILVVILSPNFRPPCLSNTNTTQSGLLFTVLYPSPCLSKADTNALAITQKTDALE